MTRSLCFVRIADVWRFSISDAVFNFSLQILLVECFSTMNSMSIPNSSKSTECTNLESSKLPRGLVGMKGLPLAKGARLPSLRGPRDLTLGGAAKRIFTPNVSQCKERGKNNDSVVPVCKPERSGKNKRRTKEHVYRKPRSNFIQTKGVVFGEIPVGIKNNPEPGFRNISKRSPRSDKNILPKSVPKSKQNEDKEMQKLLRDDFIDDDEDDTDKLFPTILPISSRTETVNHNAKKNWVRIIAEQDEDNSLSDSSLSKENKNLSTCGQHIPEQMHKNAFDLDNLPKSGKLLLFQFPDCLPGLKEKPEIIVKTEPGVESPGLAQKKKGNVKKKEAAANSCTLADWPEGYLGKLRIHKSGKTYLVIGSLILDINISTSVEFLQELVSLQIKNNAGDMTVLGHVNEKVVCVPSAEALLASCS